MANLPVLSCPLGFSHVMIFLALLVFSLPLLSPSETGAAKCRGLCMDRNNACKSWIQCHSPTNSSPLNVCVDRHMHTRSHTLSPVIFLRVPAGSRTVFYDMAGLLCGTKRKKQGSVGLKGISE